MTSNIKEMGAHYHGKDLHFRRRPVGLNPPRFNSLATAMNDPASIGQFIPNRPAQASDWLMEVADLLDPQDMTIPTDEVIHSTRYMSKWLS